MEALTLNEAIEHLTEMLIKDEFSCEECRNEHNQLRDWLIQLKEYKEKEEQGLLLRLPCNVGDTVYHLEQRHTKCSKYQQEMDEYNCCGCDLDFEECDSKIEWYIRPVKLGLSYIVEFMLTEELRVKYRYYITREEAEKALEEMKNDTVII